MLRRRQEPGAVVPGAVVPASVGAEVTEPTLLSATVPLSMGSSPFLVQDVPKSKMTPAKIPKRLTRTVFPK